MIKANKLTRNFVPAACVICIVPLLSSCAKTTAKEQTRQDTSQTDVTFNYNDEPQQIGRLYSGYMTNDIKIAHIDDDPNVDILLSNGIDRVSEDNTILFGPFGNGAEGTLAEPLWLSAVSGHNFNIAVGDINLDGDLDLAASRMMNRYGDYGLGGATVYTNLERETTKVSTWKSDDKYTGAGITLADIDADGDLDLITSSLIRDKLGDGYPRIYINRNGKLDKIANAFSKEKLDANDVVAADINMDGWMDLVFSGPKVSVYYGKPVNSNNIPYASIPDWQSEKEIEYSFAADVVKFANHETQSIVASFGCDINLVQTTCEDSGYALFNPKQSKQALWKSAPGFITSGVTIADVSSDGIPDLIGATWVNKDNETRKVQGQVLIYKGLDSGEFENNPGFESKELGIFQNVVAYDVNSTRYSKKSGKFKTQTSKKQSVFTLEERSIQQITKVTINNKRIAKTGSKKGDQYHWTSISGMNWVTISPAVPANKEVKIHYDYSNSKDIIVTDANPSSTLLTVFFSGNL